MAKKKSARKSKAKGPEHALPTGFWAQVGALLLVALAILLVVTWFSKSGQVLEGLHQFNYWLAGWGAYVVPFVLIYLAVQILQSDANRSPIVVYLAGVLLVFEFSALAGLMFESDSKVGGVLGNSFNNLIVPGLVNASVAVFIYLLTILITFLFLFRIQPLALIDAIRRFIDKARSETTTFTPTGKEVLTELASAKPELEVSGVIAKPVGRAELNIAKYSNQPEEPVAAKSSAEPDRTALVSVFDPNWKAPSEDILELKESLPDAGDVEHRAQVIQNTLREFNIEVEVTGANVGPRVTQYTLVPSSGVKIQNILGLSDNIALNLATSGSLRIEAPIPGKRAVGIEVPNVRAADVKLRGILGSPVWKSSRDSLTFAIGRDISGDAVVADLHDMPHVLVAGQTGAGKSVMINSLLVSLLYRNSPSDLKLILIDPKKVEMAAYHDIPHLLTPIVTEAPKALAALNWAVTEMERRFNLFAENQQKNINSYNQSLAKSRQTVEKTDAEGNPQQHRHGAMPYIVVVVDELSDLMMEAAKNIEPAIVRLAQKGRAAGIHLVLATQRPSVDVVTGLIKANVPSRIAFTVASQVDSKTILDRSGAEKLLGKGDLLMLTTKITKPLRVQGAWVSDKEVEKVTDFLRSQQEVEYNDEVMAQEVNLGSGVGATGSGQLSNEDEALLLQAAELVIDAGRASTTMLQTQLSIGYARAARIMAELENRGAVGPARGAVAREVLVSEVSDLFQG